MKFLERQFNRLPWLIRWPLVIIGAALWVLVAIIGRIARWVATRQVGIRLVVQLPSPQDARKKLTATVKRRILKRDNWTCRECGHGKNDGIKTVVDHHIGVALAPELVTASWNLKTLCGESAPGNGDGGCNRAKSDEIPPTVIDWDQDPPREICSTAEFLVRRRTEKPEHIVGRNFVTTS